VPGAGLYVLENEPAVKPVENDKMPKTDLDKRGAVMMRQLFRLNCLA